MESFLMYKNSTTVELSENLLENKVYILYIKKFLKNQTIKLCLHPLSLIIAI